MITPPGPERDHAPVPAADTIAQLRADLRQLLERDGVSLRAAADMVHYSPSTLSRALSPDSPALPTRAVVTALANTFDAKNTRTWIDRWTALAKPAPAADDQDSQPQAPGTTSRAPRRYRNVESFLTEHGAREWGPLAVLSLTLISLAMVLISIVASSDGEINPLERGGEWRPTPTTLTIGAIGLVLLLMVASSVITVLVLARARGPVPQAGDSDDATRRVREPEK
ncbi:helix-turn-helix domain-containing protein [Actinokineospora sp. NPDC004072]